MLSIFIPNLFLKFLFAGLTVFLWLFSLYFFRDPERKLPEGYKENQVISPGDGKVVVIEDIVNKETNIFEKDEPS